MWTGIELLHTFQDISHSIPDLVDRFFLIISMPEFQYFLPIILMGILLWCFGSRQADLLMFNFGFSNIVGYLVKNIVKQPRPWILDPTLDPSPEARKGAPGYSLPSGHTTSALSSYGTMARMCRGRILSVIFIALCILIPFARMYLQVHTPLDIIVATIITIVVCLVNFRILNWSYRSSKNRTYVLIGYAVAGIVISIACDIFAGKPFSNKMCGFCSVMPICILIKERYIAYEVPDVHIKDRILLAIPGVVATALILEGIFHLIHAYNITIGVTVAIAFITVLYPMILKKWMKKEIASTANQQE